MSLLQFDRKINRMLSNGKKSKKPHNVNDHQIHEKSMSGSNFSTQAQDVTSSSISHSLSHIWELENKQALALSSRRDRLDISELKSELEEIHSLSYSDPSMAEKYELLSSNSDAGTDLTTNSSSSITCSAQPAAAFYSSISLRNDASVLELCESVDRLNQYLKAAKVELKGGVPGKFLHAVIGQEAADVGSVVSTIACAFFLSETRPSSQICVLPVINCRHSDFVMHSELKWLLKTCRVDESSLVFIDEIDLAYHNRFGNLKLVLVNGHKFPSKKKGLNDAPVEEFNPKEDGSCCTLISEKYAETSPEILAGNGFSRLLLSGILLDTKNMNSSKCTSKDRYMATLLIRGSGRFGCSGLYQILKHKISDISDLRVRDILYKDFKKWGRVSGERSKNIPNTIGMSSIGISVEELLKQEEFAQVEVISFLASEKLRLLMIVSGYYDSLKTFKREILVSTDTPEVMRNFLNFFSINGTNLPLKAMRQLDLREELRAFEIDNMLTSRRSIEKLLEEFNMMLRRH
ncbi:exopolyphosphatase PRUNE1-like [Zingiber officinale]|nr:exopolyphosphatase PRUNE1-like [Zingiber officinale]